jgi:hypothetical protein
VVTPSGGRQARRPDGRAGSARPEEPSSLDADPGARLAPREQARIDDAVVTVARRGRGPGLVAALVAGAFVIGLVRPWDWVDGGPRDTAGPNPDAGAVGEAPAASAAPVDGGPAGSYQSPTCAYPSSWRTASLRRWGGREARVWAAAEASSASGPADPAILFHAIPSEVVDAIGWCAPVTGPERPPPAAAGTLFLIRDGVADEVAVDRLEPASANALGQLWAPLPGEDERRRPWQPGRYVIRLATPSGSYVRYLGLDVGRPARSPEPTPGPGGSPEAGASPGRP